MPSNWYLLRNALTELMKVALLAELEIMSLKRWFVAFAWLKKNYDLRFVITGCITYEKSPPPTAINTLSPEYLDFWAISCLKNPSSSFVISIYMIRTAERKLNVAQVTNEGIEPRISWRRQNWHAYSLWDQFDQQRRYLRGNLCVD